MHALSPAAGTTTPRRRRPRQATGTWPHIVSLVAPVVVTAVYGAWWIAAHAGGGRASAHTLWQSLALAETLLALLLRQRKPAGALAGILAAYLLLALDPLLLPGVLVALFTVAATARHDRTLALAATATAAAIAAMPYLHGDPVTLTGYLLPRLAAAEAAAALGTWLHARRQTGGERARPRRRAGEPEPRGTPARPGPAGRSR